MKGFLSVFLCLFLVFASVACVAEANYDIGVTILFRTDEWSVDIEACMKRLAESYGINLMVNDGEGNTSKMVSYAEDYVTMGVDAVISTALDQSAVDTIASVCNDANIPVFFYDVAVEDFSKATGYTTCDTRADGYTIADWIGKYVETNMPDDEKITVAVIDYFPSQICIERCDATIERLNEIFGDRVEIVARENGEAVRAVGMTVMENILTANDNDVDFCVSIAGWDVTAGCNAAVDATKADTVVVGVAWGTECCEALEQANTPCKACLLGLPSDLAKIVTAANDYLSGKAEKPVVVEYTYVMADIDTIHDLDWRAIKAS